MAGHSDQGFAESENASFLQPAVEWGTKPVSSFLEMAAEPVLSTQVSWPAVDTLHMHHTGKLREPWGILWSLAELGGPASKPSNAADS